MLVPSLTPRLLAVAALLAAAPSAFAAAPAPPFAQEAAAEAEPTVRLHGLYSEGMVLQRDRAVPVRGWAAPGETLAVAADWPAAAQNGGSGSRVPTVITVADDQGHFRALLGAGNAGGPYTITVTAESDGSVRTVRDVWLGEVWLCSGQSNMEWPVSAAAPGSATLEASSEEPADWARPHIRLFEAPHRASATPEQDVKASWVKCSPQSAQSFSAVALHFATVLQQELHVPIGLIGSHWGGTPAEAWTSAETIANGFPELAKRAGQAQEEDKLNQHTPSALYNGMLAPLVGFPVAGVIWYQGESNRTRAEQYEKLFPAMIIDWRRAWARQLPFYFVQIAPYAYGDDTGEAAALRDAQRLTHKQVADTGMVVTLDIGNPADIHPRNKHEVGRRLALWAMAKTYGRKDLVHSGPLPGKMEHGGRALLLHFEHVGEGLRAPQGLSHFEVAGPNHEWQPAEATISDDGKSVKVSCRGIETPIMLRYAWGAADAAELFNSAGLPATSFSIHLFYQ